MIQYGSLPEKVSISSLGVTDQNGNESAPSAGLELTVDGAPDALSIGAVVDQVGTLTGALQNGATSNDAQPLVTGSGAEPGALIKLYDGQSLIGTAVAGPDGTWSVAPESALLDGSHSLSVVQVDAGGHASVASGGFAVTIDTAAAQLVIDSVIDDVAELTGALQNGATSNDAQPLVTGAGAEAGALIRLYDGQSLVGSAVALSDGTWSVSPTAALLDGSHSLTVVQIDQAGNQGSASAAFDLTIDTSYGGSAPQTDPTSTADEDDRRPLIQVGAGLDPAPSLYIDGQKVEAVYDAAAGTLQPVAPLSDGTHTIS